MKVTKKFTVRQICDDYILVPLGDTALEFAGMVTTNEVGAFLWDCLQEEISFAELTDKLLDEFEIDRESAEADIREFLQQVKANGLLEGEIE